MQWIMIMWFEQESSVKQQHNGGLSLGKKTGMATDTHCSLSSICQFRH